MTRTRPDTKIGHLTGSILLLLFEEFEAFSAHGSSHPSFLSPLLDRRGAKKNDQRKWL